MDFKEKRRFLPLDHEGVNEKLEEYQLKLESFGTEDIFVGRRLLGQEMIEGILGQAEAAEKWSKNLSEQVGELREKLLELKKTAL